MFFCYVTLISVSVQFGGLFYLLWWYILFLIMLLKLTFDEQIVRADQDNI